MLLQSNIQISQFRKHKSNAFVSITTKPRNIQATYQPHWFQKSILTVKQSRRTRTRVAILQIAKSNGRRARESEDHRHRHSSICGYWMTEKCYLYTIAFNYMYMLITHINMSRKAFFLSTFSERQSARVLRSPIELLD